MDSFPVLPALSLSTCMQTLKNALPVDPFVLQIGAMDGKRFDLIHEHLSKGGWRGLLVEPTADMFALLRQTYADQPELELANCAIDDTEGTLALYRVTANSVETGLLPDFVVGMTSAFLDRGLQPYHILQQDAETGLQNCIEEVRVPCMPLQKLLDKHAVTEIHAVVIDTEGYDWKIARQLDLSRYRPSLICLEYRHLMPTEIHECHDHFRTHGYSFAVCQEDPMNFLFYLEK